MLFGELEDVINLLFLLIVFFLIRSFFAFGYQKQKEEAIFHKNLGKFGEMNKSFP